ncbi:MAG TPA: hypothetical protein VG204_07795 [Terriglobia bacterium]|nr:hypothetical protein [Terriglobia bacterium]
MQLLAVVLARVTALTLIHEWDPRSKLFVTDFIKALVERYGFLVFPKTLEDYRSPNGAVFTAGKMGDIVIENVTLYAQGVVVDTRSSTTDSDLVLTDIANWVETLSGVQHADDRISRRFYLSQLSFRSESNLDCLNPKLNKLASWLTEIVSKHAKQRLEFETTAISFQFDQQKHKSLSLPMRIERLESAIFEENKYFSSAPLPTDEHIAFLNEFEAALIDWNG